MVVFTLNDLDGWSVREKGVEAQGGRDERGTGTGWYAQGRVCADVGRKARRLGGRWPSLWWLGNLPPQGITGRSESTLCGAVHRLVWPVDPALERRGQDVGAGGEQVRLRGRARHAPLVRRQATPLGVQASLASRTVP